MSQLKSSSIPPSPLPKVRFQSFICALLQPYMTAKSEGKRREGGHTYSRNILSGHTKLPSWCRYVRFGGIGQDHKTLQRTLAGGKGHYYLTDSSESTCENDEPINVQGRRSDLGSEAQSGPSPQSSIYRCHSTTRPIRRSIPERRQKSPGQLGSLLNPPLMPTSAVAKHVPRISTSQALRTGTQLVDSLLQDTYNF